MPTTLVTGGAGYIGSHAVQDLVDAGRSVVVIDDFSAGLRELIPSGVPIFEGDFANPDVLAQVFAAHDVDSVVHFAALKDAAASVFEPLSYYAENVEKSVSLLNQLVERGVHKIVFSSTAAVYGTVDGLPITEDFPTAPENPYGWSKLMFEQVLTDADRAGLMRSVSLRYFNAAGADPLARRGNAAAVRKDVVSVLMECAAAGRSFTVNGVDWATPDGSPVRDLIHVCDLASAHTRALEYLDGDGESLIANLGSEQGFSVLELAERVRAITGSEFSIVRGARREGDIEASVASSRRAEQQLGWKPAHSSLDEIIESAWRWDRERGRA